MKILVAGRLLLRVAVALILLAFLIWLWVLQSPPFESPSSSTTPTSPNPGILSPPAGRPIEGVIPPPYPMQSFMPGDATPSETNDAYPPPDPYSLLPYKIQSLLSNKAYLDGVDALVLDNQRAWIVTQDGARQVGDFSDVAAIFGWNYDGSKVLIGRGLYNTKGMSESTELWIYDLATEMAYRLLDSTRIWSAAWSPVEDLIAYCEWGETPMMSVVNSDGQLVYHLDEPLSLSFSWSPNGEALVVSYTRPESLTTDTRYSVLAIWWLAQNEIELFSKATKESHTDPVWLRDGSRILFSRSFGSGSWGGQNGLYLASTRTKGLTYIPGGPKYMVGQLSRSSQSDTFLFVMGDKFGLFTFGESPIMLGTSYTPVWHPDGKTIVYSEKHEFHFITTDTTLEGQISGGDFSPSVHYLQPDIFFMQVPTNR